MREARACKTAMREPGTFEQRAGAQPRSGRSEDEAEGESRAEEERGLQRAPARIW